MAPTLARIALVALALARIAPAQSPAEAPPPPPAPAPAPSTSATPGLLATQATIVIAREGKARKFRATVMARKDDLVTVLTAAHCLSAADADGPAVLVLGEEPIRGTVVSVVRNPSFKPDPLRELPGADNAVARFRFRPSGKAQVDAFEALQPAQGLTTRNYPSPGGQTVSVRMVDQHGVEHVVKAGNYSNPRVLEWGLSFQPSPGDSGAGVFAMSVGADGRPPQPILIGVIATRDDKGGNASLVSREIRWVADELAR